MPSIKGDNMSQFWKLQLEIHRRTEAKYGGQYDDFHEVHPDLTSLYKEIS